MVLSFLYFVAIVAATHWWGHTLEQIDNGQPMEERHYWLHLPQFDDWPDTPQPLTIWT